jgi:lysophospholipase L1-like esterase
VDDPILDYRYVPYSVSWIGAIAYRYNGAGFRDVEHAVAKPPGVERIAVVGDSVSEGYGVPFHDVFADDVQRRLGSSIEVLNIAMSGLNSPQEVHLLETDGLRYQPDLVVLNFVLNDCDFYSLYKPALAFGKKKDSEIGLLGIPVPPAVKRALKSSALIYFVKERTDELMASEDHEAVDYVASIWSKPENRKKVSDSLEKLAALGRAHGFDAVVLIWPVLVDFESYPYREIHRWVAEQAESLGIPAIDLLPAFAEAGGRSRFFLSADDAFHPNGRGHDVAAAAFEHWYRIHRSPTSESPSG